MILLSTPIKELPKIGLAYRKKLEKLGIKTVYDLLFYFPGRYDDFSKITPIKKVNLSDTVCVQGIITEVKHKRIFKKWMDITEATIEDNTGSIKALWFNQPYLAKYLKENSLVCLAGKVSLGKSGIYLNNPAHERVNENSDLVHTGRIVPVYRETRGLTSRWLRYMIKYLLSYSFDKTRAPFSKGARPSTQNLSALVPETLPPEIIKKHKFLPIKKAIWQIHFPDSFELSGEAKSRFAFEELFLLELSVLREKAKLMQKQGAACPMDIELMKKFTNSLPFSLTDSQKKCSFQILKDLEKPMPMSRLLEGDVGSGKTVVATMAALNVAKQGHQVAFMAPTEILAKQHFKSIGELLKDFGISIGFLTGKEAKIFRDKETRAPERINTLGARPSTQIKDLSALVFEVKKESLLEDLKNGQIDIMIGTHSLIQKGVEFKDLAFVIVDEQHRFGVSQRANLTKNKKLAPHLLSMTATPIPRTLALTVYGDLDLSLIKEMPKNRKKTKTLIVQPDDRKNAYEFIRKEVKEGKGVFVICPRIEVKNDKIDNLWSDVKAVKEEYEKLSNEIFPDLKISMMHGKIKTKEKGEIMQNFRDGKIDVLVSTSVVEVGVDVPRATIMMIEGAEKFGLAQLHQFRGRVGRSDMQSYCFLFTTSPNQLDRKRLKALVDSDNGFELAQKDLEIRGPGQLYGKQQWGIPDMAMQGLSDIFLVEKTREAAKEILEKDPELVNFPLLREKLNRFESKIHFE